MNSSWTLLFCFTCLLVNGQTEFDSPATKPNAHLKSIIESEKLGVKLLAVELTPCDNSDGGNIKSRIASKKQYGDTLVLDIAFETTCCVSFDTGIAVVDDNTVELLFTEYGDFCFCSCCYHLTYSLLIKKRTINMFLLNGKPIIETGQIHKDETTEIEYYDNGEIKTKIFKIENEIYLVCHFDLTGTIIQTDYYSNGKLVKTNKR